VLKLMLKSYFFDAGGLGLFAIAIVVVDVASGWFCVAALAGQTNERFIAPVSGYRSKPLAMHFCCCWSAPFCLTTVPPLPMKDTTRNRLFKGAAGTYSATFCLLGLHMHEYNSENWLHAACKHATMSSLLYSGRAQLLIKVV